MACESREQESVCDMTYYMYTRVHSGWRPRAHACIYICRALQQFEPNQIAATSFPDTVSDDGLNDEDVAGAVAASVVGPKAADEPPEAASGFRAGFWTAPMTWSPPLASAPRPRP